MSTMRKLWNVLNSYEVQILAILFDVYCKQVLLRKVAEVRFHFTRNSAKLLNDGWANSAFVEVVWGWASR